MTDSPRADKYKKNAEQERALQQMNETLAQFEDQLAPRVDAPKHPLLFLVGCPRTGTTLLSQLLAASGLFAYVSNFVARFWIAPWLGASIGLALGLARLSSPSNLKSTFGQTTGWTEPHEFGYFWDRWFEFGETAKLSEGQLAKIDRTKMKRAFAALQAAYDRPMFFKNQNKYSLQIEFLAELFDNAYFVLLERHPLYQTQSVLLARKEFCGDINIWWTMRPKEYSILKELSPFEQIAGQAFFLSRDIWASLKKLSKDRYLALTYEDLCASPRDAVTQVARLVGINPGSANVLGILPETITLSKKQQIPQDQWISLQAACRKYGLIE
jgi:LPS sulfotransferase NodH